MTYEVVRELRARATKEIGKTANIRFFTHFSQGIGAPESPSGFLLFGVTGLRKPKDACNPHVTGVSYVGLSRPYKFFEYTRFGYLLGR